MDFFDIIIIVLGAINVLAGLASLVTGKVYLMGSSAAKYTEESLKKYARPYGITTILVGVGFIALQLIKSESFPVGAVIMIVCCVAALVISIMNRKVLVKK